MKYAIVIERSPANFSAYVPDLPGCVAVAQTRQEVERFIEEAIVMHVAGLREDGLPVPLPQAEVAVVDIVNRE